MSPEQSATQPSWRQRLQVLDAFEQAWQRGESPSVESVLPANKSSRAVLLVNLVLVELEYRLRAGQPVRAEEYFARFPELADNADDAVEVILSERRQRYHQGQEPTSTEFLERFPQYQAELARRLDDAPTSLGSDATKMRGKAGITGALPERIGRYRIEHEIARGGMGKVLRVHDETFQRPLALKVLLGLNPAEPDQVERFLREARLTAQLQHPGIPPVQEMGRLPDGLPYFIMKLIKGQSLAALLRERPSHNHDLPRFLNIFEQICQTLAYAHNRNVLHRDLKPGNIMVGAFGEVQVMDWGLAKVLDVAQPAPQGKAEKELPSVHGSLPPSSTDEGKTAAGAVMGTPAYMAPEQARGEIDNLDPRSDVFGLGGILCDILTGKAPFAADSAVEAHRLAMKGDVSAAFARLDSCGVDAELVEIARRCLSPEMADRLANAGAVAEAVAKYQVDLQARLKQAEIDRAAAEVKAREEKKRRHVWLGLAAAVLFLVLGAGGAWLWYQQDRATRLADELQRQAETARKQALADKGIGEALEQAKKAREGLHAELGRQGGVVQLLNEPARWRGHINAARAALDRAAALQPEASQVEQKWSPQIAALAELGNQDDADRLVAQRLEKIRLDRSMVFEGRMNLALARREYPLAFAAAGFRPEDGTEKSLTHFVRASPIKEQLLAALDDWTYVLSISRDAPQDLLARLTRIAREADPDSWAAAVRDPALWRKPLALKGLADKALADPKEFARQSPQALYMMSRRLAGQKDIEETWLRRAQAQHPSDFWLNYQLGVLLSSTKPAAAEGFCRAAIAVRRDSSTAWYSLGNALRSSDQLPAAIAAYRKALEFAPDMALAWLGIGSTRYRDRDYPAAIEAFEKAVALDPKNAIGWYNLGQIRGYLKDLPGAHAAYRKAVAVQPSHAEAQRGLVQSCQSLGRFADAVAAGKQALAVLPAGIPQRAVIERHIAECKKLLARDERVVAVLGGAEAGAQERIVLAEYCLRDKRAYRDAASLYGSAFAADGTLADAIRAHRFHAARAALFAAGRETDAAEPSHLRKQALDWLRADIKQWQDLVAAKKPVETMQANFWVRSWLSSPDFASVRPPEASKLPEAEQEPWRKLWSDVGALVKEARGQFVQTQFKGNLSKDKSEQVHEAALVAGRTYLFEMQSQQLDALLRLEDALGKKLLENDDISKENRNARILFMPKTSGTYRLIAGSYQGRGSGAYALFIFEFAEGKNR